VVVGTTILMEWVGLSASLGAFLAGVVLADSEYRHELEADLEPFKGLLLGLFFMAVGMGANLGLLADAPLTIAALAALLLAVKFLILLVVGKLAGRTASSARKLAVALAQGGEFAFVIFQLARQEAVLELAILDTLTVAVTLSMLLWPLLFLFEERLLARWLDRAPPRPFDTLEDQGHPVIIAGFGRVGQIVARVLTVRGIPFTVLEADPQQVDYVRRFGNKVYFGDASRLDLLQAAGVERARVFVLAIDDVDASLKTAALLRKHFPRLPVIARARNRFHAYKLLDLGITAPIRETWHGSLALSELLLAKLGLPEAEARRTVERFAAHDTESLLRQHAVYQDEAQLVASIQQAREELRSLFDQDANAAAKPVDKPAP
jgi:glutathione-regulated potassium-efflux system ancillary protein KefC/glutathione-regulated potassium-efflux system protein KefB